MRRRLVRIALQQAGEFASQGHAAVFGIAGAGLGGAGQPHHGGEVVAGRALLVEHAEQRQGVDPPGLLAQAGQLALDVAGQRRVGAFHQLGAGQAEAGQVQAGEQQRRAIGAGPGLIRRGLQVSGPLLQVAGQVALGLQQQALRVAGELAGGEQLAGAEPAQVREARREGPRQFRRQLGQGLFEVIQGLQRRLLAHGVAAAEVLADVARDLFVEALRQLQVAIEQLERTLHGALRPPQGDSQGEADGEQEQGVEVGELLEAHDGSRPTTERRDRRLFPFGYHVMTKRH